jgi:hypothetical protein
MFPNAHTVLPRRVQPVLHHSLKPVIVLVEEVMLGGPLPIVIGGMEASAPKLDKDVVRVSFRCATA